MTTNTASNSTSADHVPAANGAAGADPRALLPPSSDGARKLADGRTLGFGLYGAGDGPLVVVLDGPGSRGLGRALATEAERLGVTLLVPDRPGFGASTPVGRRTIPEVAGDLLALVDALGCERFGLVAQSGGTPYALALAHAAGHRVTGLALVGGIVPLGEKDALRDVSGPMRTTFKLARRAPWLLKPLIGVVARKTLKDPAAAARAYAKDLPPLDTKALEDPRMWAIHEVTSAEAVSSPAAFAREARMLARPWGFDLEAPRAPVALWVGEQDPVHPPVMSRRLSERLGGAPVTLVPGAATFGMNGVYGDVLQHAAALS
ncbi:MAG TPA: alpha/beta hydrolase [Solirubrobacteraceae bacterium]|jgi:pimeloyl-ACP methyl ester carboxylesterase